MPACGFTLLEMLIAIVITTMIAGVMGSAIRLGIRSLEVGERRTELFERFKTSLNVIDAQLQAEIPALFRNESNARRFCFSGNRSQLSFATNYSIWRGAKGYVMVEYRIETNPAGKQVLYASERVPGAEERSEIKLLDALDEIYFAYFCRDNRTPGGLWVDQWSDSLAIPEKVSLHLTQGRKKMAMAMPLRSRGFVDWIMAEETTKR
jgi:general secretion pathway protein J